MAFLVFMRVALSKMDQQPTEPREGHMLWVQPEAVAEINKLQQLSMERGSLDEPCGFLVDGSIWMPVR